MDMVGRRRVGADPGPKRYARIERRLGSYIVVSKDGWVVTCAHRTRQLIASLLLDQLVEHFRYLLALGVLLPRFDYVQGITAAARDKPDQNARLDVKSRTKTLLERVG